MKLVKITRRESFGESVVGKFVPVLLPEKQSSVCVPDPAQRFDRGVEVRAGVIDLFGQDEVPSLSTSGETLTIEESMTLRARTENAGHVGDEHEWSWGCG